MNAAKCYRKMKEVEEQKLQNRCALLKIEIQRSQKKIDETQKRTAAIQEHRAAILRRHEQRVAESRRREEELAMHTDLNNKMRERMTTLRRANVLQVQYTKKEEAKAVADQTQVNEATIKRQRALEKERANEVKRLIRDQRLASNKAREEEILRKKAEARAEFHRRLEMESKRSADSEANVAAMETLELELIAKLEQAQQTQRAAYSALEEALIDSKRTIMEKSRETLRETVVDSGQVRRSPRPRKRGGRRNRTPVQQQPPREMVAAN